MEILKLHDLNIHKVEKQYTKVINQLVAGDFRSADVRKIRKDGLYRAKLDTTNRLLFKIGKYKEKTVLLILEVIFNHDYSNSRFLGEGHYCEDDFEAINVSSLEPSENLKFYNDKTKTFHILNNILSFDDVQENLFFAPLPQIIIGSAGSGKTALTLERIKTFTGNILYITHSPYLVEHSRNLYFANNFKNDEQNIDFLSFKEFLESISMPKGKEADFAVFKNWFMRNGGIAKSNDAHKLFEEFKGVLTGLDPSKKILSRDEYLNLGIKQSILQDFERDSSYNLFTRYASYLESDNFYDTNMLSFTYLTQVTPDYDFVVVDEVQDFTNIQLSLILKALNNRRNFILTGDSNQIVHPNFFSWARVKSYFYNTEADNSTDIIRILHTNYRNSTAVTALSNQVLLLKQKRFGSIDKESNYLVKSVGSEAGSVELFDDNKNIRTELNEASKLSTSYAIIVPNENTKQEVRKIFSTPLVFSIYEAKGLEYENVILFGFIDSSAQIYAEICEGITASDLDTDLAYSRSKDKADKSGELYKFFINSFFVAVTRCMKNLLIIDKNASHSFYRVLGLQKQNKRSKIEEKKSSLEDWSREAHKLELQGKKEQADLIKKDILKIIPVPWQIMTDKDFETNLQRAIQPGLFDKKAQRSILEYAVYFVLPQVFKSLVEAKYTLAANRVDAIAYVNNKYLTDYRDPNGKIVKENIKKYGIDYPNQFGESPLLCATRTGNVTLVEYLCSNGANINSVNQRNLRAHQLALLEALQSQVYAKSICGQIFSMTKPTSIRFKLTTKVIKLDSHTMEYFLLNLLFAVMTSKLLESAMEKKSPLYTAVDLTEMLSVFPDNVIPEFRRQRPYISSIFAKNEIQRDHPYNRKLFVRLKRGEYALNPLIEVDIEGNWVGIYDCFKLVERTQCGYKNIDVVSKWLANYTSSISKVQTKTNV